MKFKRGLEPKESLEIGISEIFKKHIADLMELSVQNISRVKNDLCFEVMAEFWYSKGPFKNLTGRNLNKVIKNHPISEFIHKNYYKKDSKQGRLNMKYYFKIREESLNLIPCNFVAD